MFTQKCTPVFSWMHSIPTSTSWCRVAGEVMNHCVAAAALSPAVALPLVPLSRSVQVCAHGRMKLSHSKWNIVMSEGRYKVSMYSHLLYAHWSICDWDQHLCSAKKKYDNLITCFLMKRLIIWFTQWFQTKWWSHHFSIIDLQSRGHLCPLIRSKIKKLVYTNVSTTEVGKY